MQTIHQELIQDNMSEQIIKTAEDIATIWGPEHVNVRKILNDLQITNRVFYNRFHNIDEVLSIVYDRAKLKIRESITKNLHKYENFYDQVINIVASTLIMSYENKMNLNQFIFLNDSLSEDNYNWWKDQIEKLIKLGKSKGIIKDIDEDIMSYSIWCFIRGYNVDCLARKIPKDIAVENFKYSFKILLDGMSN